MTDSDGKVNVLLVDDRPEKLLALEAVLEDLGQNIVRATSGREALRHVLNMDFAVILLDVNMPGMDGFETAGVIRQRKNSEHTPIIFITAFGDEMLAARGYSLGAVDYILTPVVPEVLRSKVAVFVDLFRKSEQVKRQAESLQRRAAQMQKLAAASVAINSALSLDKMLQTITDTARDVIGAHQAITLFIDPRPGARPQDVQAYSSFSEKYANWRGQPLHLEAITRTLVFRNYTATRLTEAELLAHPDWDIVRKVRIPPIRGGMLAAPFTGRDGTRLGVIYLCDRGEAPFTAHDESIAVQLAQMASIAIENTLFAEEREANRIKDEFLSTLSHELRTPLNAIVGWTQLLRMENPQGEMAHGLEVIDRNARSQTRLIEDLLDISRISTGKLKLNRRVVSVGAVIRAAAEAVKPSADARGVELRIDEPSPGLSLLADPDRLQQVIWNLLSNAVKFTAAGGWVAVETVQSNGQVQLCVKDTGAGIDPAFVPYVFDRFRQADSSSTRSHGGLGIGLAIVRHIVELHGGTVHAHSDGEGKGSAFTVHLPIAASNADHSPLEPGRHGVGNGESQRHLAGMRIVVVDDAPDALEVVAAILRRAGAEVSTAISAAEARRLIHRTRPNLLISDIAMPDEDGLSLVQSLRQLSPEEGGTIPAVALTAYARTEDGAATLAAGFQAHLAKPVEPDELIDAVARYASPAQVESFTTSQNAR